MNILTKDLTKDWILLASTPTDRVLSKTAHERIEELIASSVIPCAIRQAQPEPGRFETHLMSKESIHDTALLHELRDGFEIIVRADGGELPLNPSLPSHFSDLRNEDRTAQELAVWWDQPYVQGPENGPYTVHCLDGGAWDRPTWYGQAFTLDEATKLAAAKLTQWHTARKKVMTMMSEPPCLVRMPQHPHQGMEIIRKFANMDELTAYVNANKSDMEN